MGKTKHTNEDFLTGQSASKIVWPTEAEIRYREVLLLITPLLLLSAYPFLRVFEHGGTADLYAGIRITGALIALLAGCAFIAGFHSPGRRFHMFIGIAFFIAGTEDLTLGFLELAKAYSWLAPHEAILRNSFASRTLVPLLLLLPLLFPAWDRMPRNPVREALLALLSVPLLVAITLQAAFLESPLPLREGLTRPLDLLSATLFAASFFLYFREYHRTRNRIIWWLGLSIGFMLAGQMLLPFSRELYDPFFGIARVYSILGYTVSLLGFSLRRISTEDYEDWLIFRMSAEVDRVNAIYLEDVVLENMREISDSHMATILAMSKLTESRNDETGRHIERTQELCRILARKLREHPQHTPRIDNAFVENIFYAAALHDIGKIGIPDAVLLKEERLSRKDMETIRRHPEIGAATLEQVRGKYPGNEFLNMGIELAHFHHEKWDGSGYPEGLAGENIPLSARIMALVDVYDALRSKRLYKSSFSREETCALIRKGDGVHFDPSVVEAFFEVEAEFDGFYQHIEAHSGEGRDPAGTGIFTETSEEKEV